MAARTKAGGRSVLPGIIFIAACLLCLGTGFFVGKMYGTQTTIETVKAPAAAADDAARGEPGAKEKSGLFTAVLGKKTAVVAKPICLNTCSKAKNGICDDGRIKNGTMADPKTPREVFCDLGTDCDDCGPWVPDGPAPWEDGTTPGPVSVLMSKEVKVVVRETNSKPPLTFAYTDHKKDVDVSYHMHAHNMVEAGISKIFYKILNGRCTANAAKRGLFVDVGANFGYFAVYAASMGCRVIAYEPVPAFRAFLEYTVHINNMAPLVDIRPVVVSHEAGKTMKMVVPSHGIWGTAGIDGMNIDPAIKATREELNIPSVRLEDQVAEDVLLMKVDVEGWEWSVMQGAARLFSKYNVENVIMEYSPGVPERHFKFDQIQATVQMLIDLIGHGFRIGHIGDGKHMDSSWDQPLLPYNEVLAANLKYDMEDAKRWSKGQLGCPIPEEAKKFLMWGMCNAVPEDMNPRSMRAEIGHNTNLWASKNKTVLPLAGRVGILDPEAPAEQFFITNSRMFGMGARPCRFLEPKVQVRHRCKCTNAAICGEEEKVITELAKAGKIGNNYVLP